MVIDNDVLLHGADYTPLAGIKVTGWPVEVMVRGKRVVSNGQLAAQAQGQYLARGRSALV